ncbi:MAG: TPM domain-containing protein, partial [Gemmatimonadota bacterium]|nr:TPM domain-containing protein [Gemmatimonadota bacterium]
MLALALLLLGAGAAAAQIRLPGPVGYVNDFAGVIRPERAAEIERVIDEVRAKSGGEIVVVTLPSLEGRTRDEVALQIGREWRVGAAGEVGERGRNSGAVVLVVPTERQLKIELGYGANTFITAAEAGRVRDLMTPAFQEGDFGTGILLGVGALAQEYAREFGFQLTGNVPALPEQRTQRGRGGGGGTLLLVIAILIFFALANRGGRGGGGGRGG